MLGVYIHIPFCKSKCKYCDFASYPNEIGRQDEYIDKIIAELKQNKGLKADTIYIGGGTPSVLSEHNLSRLIYEIRENIELSAEHEFTIEVNPATLDKSKAKALMSGGINRISMGAQSFIKEELNSIGRIHSPQDTEHTFELLRSTGFKNISLDLMYALPNQTIKSLETSIEKALALAPEHISCYGLKFEEGTPLYKELILGRTKEQSDDVFADMYEMICTNLKSQGYTHYEISNFAKEGRESLHNLKYWLGGDYIGLGASASSKVGNRRYTYSSSIDDYIRNSSLLEDYTMTIEEEMSEFIILALRVINRGADKELFKKRFSCDMDKVFSRAIAKTEPYLINTKNALKIRNEALLVSNSIMCEFM